MSRLKRLSIDLVLRIVLVAVLAVIACRAHAFEAVDGDTVKEDGALYRLEGYDTPEIRGRCLAERMMAKLAQARMKQLLNSGQWMSVGLTGAKDRWGRKIITITLQGVPMDAIMLTEGYAVPYLCPKNRCPRRVDWCAPDRSPKGAK